MANCHPYMMSTCLHGKDEKLFAIRYKTFDPLSKTAGISAYSIKDNIKGPLNRVSRPLY